MEMDSQIPSKSYYFIFYNFDDNRHDAREYVELITVLFDLPLLTFLCNREEDHRTDPNNPDTDGDGLRDGYEVNVSFTDPLEKQPTKSPSTVSNTMIMCIFWLSSI